MAKLSELILTFQRYYNAHGDMQVVYRNKNSHIMDLLSSGLSYADNIKDEKVKVCWVSDVLADKLEISASLEPSAVDVST